MRQRLLAIQQSDMTHAARSLYAVYLAHEGEDGVARGEDGTPLTQRQAARIMGTTRPSANKYYGELREAGWIEDTPIGPSPTVPDLVCNTRTESKTYQSDTYQSDTSTYQSGTSTYQSGTSGDPYSPSPLSFSLSPFLSHSHNPSPISSPLNPSILESGGVEISISTAPPSPFSGCGVGWLPPGHPALVEKLPADHPAVSERHLRYWLAGKWSLRLLRQAEDAIESFRLPAALRRKIDRDEMGVVEDFMDTFRLLQEQDGYSWEEVRYGLHWLFTQSDWLREGYIASMASLRKKTRSGGRTKFDVILTQAKADDHYHGPDDAGRIGGHDRSDESLEERFERNYEAARRAVAEG